MAYAPCIKLVLTLRHCAVPGVINFLWNNKGGVGPIQPVTHGVDVLLGQGRRMPTALPLKPRDPFCNRGFAGNQRRTQIRFRRAQGPINLRHVMAVNFDNVPVGRAKTCADILAYRQVGCPIIRDAVVVP